MQRIHVLIGNEYQLDKACGERSGFKEIIVSPETIKVMIPNMFRIFHQNEFSKKIQIVKINLIHFRGKGRLRVILRNRAQKC